MGFLHMPKELNDLSDWVLSHWYLVRKSFPHKCGRGALGRPRSEGGVGEAGPNQMKMWSSPGLMVTSHTKLRTPDHFNSNTHWWKRWSRSKFATSHYAWGTNGVSMWMQDGCNVHMGFLHDIEWIEFHGHSDYFHKPPLGGRPNMKPQDDFTPNAHNHWFTLFHHGWGPAWMEIHWNIIWLSARWHMTSHHSWGPVTALHDIGHALGRPLDTFVWAPEIPWSQLLARVWSGPHCAHPKKYWPWPNMPKNFHDIGSHTNASMSMGKTGQWRRRGRGGAHPNEYVI